MSTERQKLQGYILPELLHRYKQWKKEKGITKDSQALNLLLSQFFEQPIDPIVGNMPANAPITERRIEEIINKQTAQKFAEMEAKINSLNAQLMAVTQAIISNTNVSNIVAVEEIQEPTGEPDLKLTQAELARRLHCRESTLSKNRKLADFYQWSEDRDSEKIRWKWCAEERLFFGYYRK